jgi:prolipoprotein diacylglyceryltransferase
MFIVWKHTRVEAHSEEVIFDTILLALIAGLIGGRVGFIILHFDSFSFGFLRWLHVFRFPGFLIPIALICAYITAYYMSIWRYSISPWQSLDKLGVLLLSIGLVFSLYYAVFDVAALQQSAGDISQLIYVQAPRSLYLLSAFIGSWIIWRSIRSIVGVKPGVRGLLVALSYGIMLFGTNVLTDDRPAWDVWTYEQLAALFLVLITLGVLLYGVVPWRRILIRSRQRGKSARKRGNPS